MKKINPDVDIKIFPEGIDENNLDAFLEDVDIIWLESKWQKNTVARLLFANGKTRLTMKEAYQAMQRLWLTASKLNLGLQLQQTPVIFNRYLNLSITFTDSKRVLDHTIKVKSIDYMFSDKAERVIFMGRLGRSQLPASRSIRKSGSELLVEPVT